MTSSGSITSLPSSGNAGSPYSALLQAPAAVGYAVCSEAGDLLESEGPDSAALGSVLAYFQLAAGLIGDSLGLEDFHEAQVQGKTSTYLVFPHKGGAVAVAITSRVRLNESIASIRRTLLAAS
jgi:hypothetical protein